MKRFALLAEEDRKEDAGPYRGLGLSEDGEPRLLRRRGHAGLSQQPSCDDLGGKYRGLRPVLGPSAVGRGTQAVPGPRQGF